MLGLSALVRLLVVAGGAQAGDWVRVSPDLELYYQEAGSGPPMVIIPGWTGTSEMFPAQLAYFSKKYRVIIYDPRSQGRSTKTLENNNYQQHGADLRAFLDALHIGSAIVVAHSAGCFDAYAYFRAYGTEHIRAFTCIDTAPKNIVDTPEDWGNVKTMDDMKSPQLNMHDRAADLAKFIQSLVTRPLTSQESDWWVGQCLQTPTYVSVLLDIETDAVDYREEAKAIDAKIPVLYVLNDRKESLSAAKAWLAKYMPHTQVAVLAGAHLLHWEFPDRFNAALDSFLSSLK
jgi:pimeloyl-ACP methyl ester carboxylesterase